MQITRQHYTSSDELGGSHDCSNRTLNHHLCKGDANATLNILVGALVVSQTELSVRHRAVLIE